MYVYLVFMNDAMLGVFGTPAYADQRIDAERARHSDIAWKRFERTGDDYGDRWHGGAIARLEWQRHEVRDAVAVDHPQLAGSAAR